MNPATPYLISPRSPPPLDSSFRPAVLACRAFDRDATVPVRLAIEQADGVVFHHKTKVLKPGHCNVRANGFFLERLCKFLLWSRGGSRIFIDGPPEIATRLQSYYQDNPLGKFDSKVIGELSFDRPIEVLFRRDLPPDCKTSVAWGQHLEGCRIGVDVSGTDIKVVAINDGNVGLCEETPWNPWFESNPQYHLNKLMASLEKAADDLPRVEAIGVSAPGVYVNNRVKVASIFRGVSRDKFDSRVREIFVEIQRKWKVPLVVLNDGDVTALAASMSLKENPVLSVSMGGSTAAGYVTPQGKVTTWLNELAFIPVDYAPAAPSDEWSGDRGCVVEYLSQKAVVRLMGAAGIEGGGDDPIKRLKHVQKLMSKGDDRARKIYETIGVYLGYALAHFAEFYELRHVIVLGRVTVSPGGEVLLSKAKEVLELEFPDLAKQVSLHMPDERYKQFAQAIAAASLPSIQSG